MATASPSIDGYNLNISVDLVYGRKHHGTAMSGGTPALVFLVQLVRAAPGKASG
jgi:hypothetical protein